MFLCKLILKYIPNINVVADWLCLKRVGTYIIINDATITVVSDTNYWNTYFAIVGICR